MPRKTSIWRYLLKWALTLGVVGVLAVIVGISVIYLRLAPNLPSIESLQHVQFQVPLRVYTEDEKLIAEFGQKRREPVKIERVPNLLRQAFLAAEDDRFYSHPGVDYQGLIRAFIHLVRTGSRGQGGSTITMQVARNFFLSNKKTYERKINEILLALQIESDLSKDKILELYLNKIYLGNRAYGVGAAAKVYYGKDVSDLSLTEAAMIAGLPKAPSRYNPIINPKRALLRRDYVLRRMSELGYISEADYKNALNKPVTAALHYSQPEVEAGYVAEMARSRLFDIYGGRIYTDGLRVYTTIDSEKQEAANRALRKALIDYEKRQGFIGPMGRIELSVSDIEEKTNELYGELIEKLSGYREFGKQKAALVMKVSDTEAKVLTSEGDGATIKLDETRWVRKRLEKDELGEKIESLMLVIKPGDVVYIEQGDVDGVVKLSPLPEVEGALVSINPQSGAILGLVGGFDFHKSKFNRAIQARRQPGSNFKPFIYSTALANGDTAATIYNDAPVVFHDSALEAEWRPENYSGRFFGPTRLREALVKSRNLVSIRILRGLGLRRSLNYVEKFGFNISKLPPDLSLALGSGSVTPLQLAGAYSVFANGGYRTNAHFISRIEDARGKDIFQKPTVTLCKTDCIEELKDSQSASEVKPLMAQEANLDIVDLGAVDDRNLLLWRQSVGLILEEQEYISPLPEREYFLSHVIDKRIAHIMSSILREVITRGTGQQARVLKRRDLAGKTGTTNDQHDAWFSGFNSQIVTSVWVGFDELKPLGAKETGGRAALPMWIDYMRVALDGVVEDRVLQPDGLVTIRIDKKTGELTSGRNPDSMMEIFREEHAPTKIVVSLPKEKHDTPKRRPQIKKEVADQLF